MKCKAAHVTAHPSVAQTASRRCEKQSVRGCSPTAVGYDLGNYACMNSLSRPSTGEPVTRGTPIEQGIGSISPSGHPVIRRNSIYNKEFRH